MACPLARDLSHPTCTPGGAAWPGWAAGVHSWVLEGVRGPRRGEGLRSGPGWATRRSARPPSTPALETTRGAGCLSSRSLRLCCETSDKGACYLATRPRPSPSRSRFMPLTVICPRCALWSPRCVSQENGKGRPVEAEPRLCPHPTPPPPWLSRGLEGLVQDASLVFPAQRHPGCEPQCGSKRFTLPR